MGKPMLAYAIDAALESELFDEVMVSTDDQEIAEVAKKFGAEVPFMRSEKTSNDYATTAEVLLEVVEMYQHGGITFEQLCCLYPCVPLLSSKTLVQAYHAFQGYDALMPVCRYDMPVEWAMQIQGGVLIPNDLQAHEFRSQDLVPKYHDVGMFYFSTTESLVKTKTLVPPGTRAFVMDEMECQDVDTLDGWKMAELKFQMRYA